MRTKLIYKVSFNSGFPVVEDTFSSYYHNAVICLSHFTFNILPVKRRKFRRLIFNN